MNDPVVIVGAGIAGLAAGTWLTARGYSVKILEALDRPGGRAVTIERPDNSGDRVDVGTQYFHSNYRRARRLVAEAGLKTHVVRSKTRFFDDRVAGGSFTTGHRVPTIRASGFWGNIDLIVKGLARMLRNPIDPYGLKVYARADALSVADAISDHNEHEFTMRTLIAAGALVEPDAEPGFDLSYLHLIRLMRIVLMTDYLVLDEGISALHTALAERLDVSLNTAAERLIWDDQVHGIELRDCSVMNTSRVILAVPPHSAANLLPPDWHSERQFLQDIPHPPAVIVTLFLDRAMPQGVWSYIFRPDPKRLVSFCVDAAQKSPGMVPSGRAALQAWICWPASERASQMEDYSLTEAIISELAPEFPKLAEWVSSNHVMRHAQAVPQFTPSHARRTNDFLASLNRRQGIEVCGDYLSGGYLESALASAERAVARIVSADDR